MIQAIEVPEIGESVESGIVVVVHIKKGDQLAIDDTVIELETDKALVEIPSPYAGRVTEVRVEAGSKVKVGDVAHPMEDKHYIEWIELVAGDTAYMQFLNPGDTPEAVFKVDADQVTAREYCNLHGHWKS